MIKKLLLILIPIFIFANNINIISWQLPSKISYNGIVKKELEKFFNNKNIDIFILQNITKYPYFFLKNKFFLYNKPYGFVISKKFPMAEISIYPDYDKIWKNPPVLLYIPKYNLSIINLFANTNFELNKKRKKDPYYYSKEEIYDLKNVIRYFYKQNYNINNLIIVGNFGIESDIIEDLNFKPLIIDTKTTIDNVNYGNFTYNIISYLNKVPDIKIYKNIDTTLFDGYYPILLNLK